MAKDLSPVQQYRRLLAHAAQVARSYTGSEADFKTLIDKGQCVDSFLDSQKGEVSRDSVERTFASQAGLRIQTVTDVLTTASARFNRLMFKAQSLATLTPLLERGGGVVVPHSLVFLPTNGSGPQTGSGAGWEVRECQPRLALLLELLQTKKIYLDDIILRPGHAQAGQVRHQPYHIVEIPRLNSQIAVCDQRGETTLVSTVIMPPAVWANCEKNVLKLIPTVHEVAFGHPSAWFEKIWDHLSTSAVRKKVNVAAEARRNHRHAYPLSEEFIVHHARLHQAETHGRTPNQQTGPVKGLPGQTWKGWEMDLLDGWRGLEGGITLRDLFIKHGLITVFTLETVQEWVINHMDRHNGKPPHCGSGPVEDHPVTTWAALDRRLKDGGYNFERVEGGLSGFLIKIGVRDRKGAHATIRRPLRRSGVPASPEPLPPG